MNVVFQLNQALNRKQIDEITINFSFIKFKSVYKIINNSIHIQLLIKFELNIFKINKMMWYVAYRHTNEIIILD